jgi:hypothetical protein
MKIKKIYIAGKVTGLSRAECTINFGTAQIAIEKLGHEAVNPLLVVNDWKASWEVAMKKCIVALMGCDLILMLDNYSDSPGARIELDLAKSLKIPVVYEEQYFSKLSKSR